MSFVAALLYAVSAAVLAALALAFAFDGLTPALAHLALGLGAATAAFALWQARRERIQWRALNVWEWSSAILFALFALRSFLWIVFFDGDEIKVLSPNNLGDLSLHLTYIRELANGVPFWPDNPILSGTKLTYPLGIDLLHSLLVLCGGDIYRGFIWLGLAGSLLTGLLLFRWGGAFTMAGFLCNGGLAGLALFVTGRFEDYQSPFGWKSIPLALFVTQRGFLFALPAGLLLLCSWKARYFSSTEEQADAARPLPRWGEWLLYASLPIFHFHTFLFLSVLLGVWFCWYPRPRLEILRLVAAAALPATLLVLLITNFFHGPKALGWAPGWMQDDSVYLTWCNTHLLAHSAAAESVDQANSIVGTETVWITRPAFWLLNFGLLPFLGVPLLRQLAREPTAVWERAFLWPSFGVFVVCCFVKFAPWPWDNTKLMIWSYLILLPILWHRLVSRWPFSVRVLVCVALFLSGFICLLGGLNDGTDGSKIASRAEVDGVAHALETISPRDRFMAHPDYNHPLLLLGRKVAMGYIGHVWSHGYEWQAASENITHVFNGENGWREIAKGFGARYLFWGNQEVEAYPDSTRPWEGSARLVASGSWGSIYDLESTSED